jgi:hypothetical protein
MQCIGVQFIFRTQMLTQNSCSLSGSISYKSALSTFSLSSSTPSCNQCWWWEGPLSPRFIIKHWSWAWGVRNRECVELSQHTSRLPWTDLHLLILFRQSQSPLIGSELHICWVALACVYIYYRFAISFSSTMSRDNRIYSRFEGPSLFMMSDHWNSKNK